MSHRAVAELVRLCARPGRVPDPGERLRGLIPQVPDWACVWRAAAHHGVAPQLYETLRPVEDLMPPAVRSRLAAHHCGHVARCLGLADEWLSLLELFGEAGLRPLPVKGPALAVQLYGGAAARQYDDLDFMLDHRDIALAGCILRARGYESRPHVDGGHEYARIADAVVVELHWSLAGTRDRFALSLEEVRERARPLLALRREIPSLAPEDLLLFLCQHGTKHGWSHLKWIADVARLLDGERSLSWEVVWGRATPLGCVRMVRLGVFLAHALLEAAPPEEEIRAARADAALMTLAREVEARLFIPGLRLVASGERGWFYCRARERLRDRVPLLADCCRGTIRRGVAVTEADRAFLPLPSPAAALYYVVRPVRLLVSRLGGEVRARANGGAVPRRYAGSWMRAAARSSTWFARRSWRER